MATTIKIGEEVTVGTTATEYVFDETTAVIRKPTHEAIIETDSGNSGTIQFSVGVTPPAGNKAFAADKKTVIQGIDNGRLNLWAKGSGAGQKFTVS